jgi:hypothetical protein
MISINPIDIDVVNGKIISNHRNFFRDFSGYVRYAQDREMKRTHRRNRIAKTDLKNLTNLLNLENTEDDSNFWLDFIDDTAYNLKMIEYFVEGVYQGYSSSEPSYPDNFITVNDSVIDNMLALPVQEQVNLIIGKVINTYKYDNNEMMNRNVLISTVDSFDYHGCATHILPTLDFSRVRRYLFTFLKKLECGKWYAISDFVAWIKNENPNFFIPKNTKERYGNFYERQKNVYSRTIVDENAPGAFERVEGRFIERFLAYIPFYFGFISFVQGEDLYPQITPSYGTIKAFKLTATFGQFLNNALKEPSVTLLPTHEFIIDSIIYPEKSIAGLLPIADLKKSDQSVIFKLNKKKASQYSADCPSINLENYIRSSISNQIPANVLADLKEWDIFLSAFILYDERYGIVEGKIDSPEKLLIHQETIAPDLVW